MDHTGKWIWSGLIALMGLVGLFIARGAAEPVPYYGGLGFFVFAVLFVMLQIRRSYDRRGDQSR